MAQQVSEPRDKVRAREQLAVLFARHRFRRIPDNEREHAIEVVRLAALTMVSPQFHQKAPHDESVPAEVEEEGALHGLFARAMLDLHKQRCNTVSLDGAALIVRALIGSTEAHAKVEACSSLAFIVLMLSSAGEEKLSEKEQTRFRRAMYCAGNVGWNTAGLAVKNARSEEERTSLKDSFELALIEQCAKILVDSKVFNLRDGLLVTDSGARDEEFFIDWMIDDHLAAASYIKAIQSMDDYQTRLQATDSWKERRARGEKDSPSDRVEFARLRLALWEVALNNMIDLKEDPEIDLNMTFIAIQGLATFVDDDLIWCSLRECEWFDDVASELRERLKRHRRVIPASVDRKFRDSPKEKLVAQRIAEKHVVAAQSDDSQKVLTTAVSESQAKPAPIPTQSVAPRQHVVPPIANSGQKVSNSGSLLSPVALVALVVFLTGVLWVVFAHRGGDHSVVRDAGSLAPPAHAQVTLPSGAVPTLVAAEGHEDCSRRIDDCSAVHVREWFSQQAYSTVCGALSPGVNAQGQVIMLDVDGDGQTEQLLDLNLSCGSANALAVARHSPAGWTLEHPSPPVGFAPIGSLEGGLSAISFRWITPMRLGTRWIIGYDHTDGGAGFFGENLDNPAPSTHRYFLFVAPRSGVWNPAFFESEQGDAWQFQRVNDSSIMVSLGVGVDTISRTLQFNETSGVFAWSGPWPQRQPSRAGHSRRGRHRHRRR